MTRTPSEAIGKAGFVTVGPMLGRSSGLLGGVTIGKLCGLLIGECSIVPILLIGDTVGLLDGEPVGR